VKVEGWKKKESGENCFASGFKMALVQKGKATCLESSYSNLIARQQAWWLRVR
jgi:hypothetical protein